MAPPALSRRGFIIGGAGVAGAAVVAGTGYTLMPRRWKGRLGLLPDPEPFVMLPRESSGSRP